MTRKLYYEDSHLREFSAHVTECRPAANGFAVVLDCTAFFPEGGGQPGDIGWLNGIPVLDTREIGGEICHITELALAPGTAVDGLIDWERRFRLMQNHSGEHVVSGIAHRLYGYDNVGFHMSGPIVTLDFNGELSEEQITDLENRANAVVYANRRIRTFFPKPDILESLNYRSKLDLRENVRLVEIEDCDLCACCAPHVKYTGEIGIIKLLSAMRHRGGMRLTMACGANALDDYRSKQQEAEACSALLSTPQTELSRAVERLKQELTEARAVQAELRRRLTEQKLEAMLFTSGHLTLFEDNLDGNALRDMVNAGLKKCGGICAGFSGSDESGYLYVIAGHGMNLRGKAKELNAALSGRGGGSAEMLQGSCRADRCTIEKVINGLTAPMK